jgi:hypothetical protein
MGMKISSVLVFSLLGEAKKSKWDLENQYSFWGCG